MSTSSPASPTCRSVRANQRRGQVSTPGCVQVHDKERQVSGDIDLPQLRLELDAVGHHNVAPRQQHVLGTQIPMAVAHSAARRAALELVPAGRHEDGGEALAPGEQSSMPPGVSQPAERRERIVEPALDRLRSASVATAGTSAWNRAMRSPMRSTSLADTAPLASRLARVSPSA